MAHAKGGIVLKIICLLASPHGKKGNTARLMEEVLKGARQNGATAEIRVLKGGTVQPCRACDRCHVEGECVQKDDFGRIRDDILAAL